MWRLGLTQELRNNATIMGPIPMLKQINPLPRTQHRHACDNWNADRDRHQGRLDMRRHVVGALIGMRKVRHRRMSCRRHQTREERFEVRLHFGVGVLLDQERTGGVLNKERQKPITLTMAPALYVPREFIKALPAGRNLKQSMAHLSPLSDQRLRPSAKTIGNHRQRHP